MSSTIWSLVHTCVRQATLLYTSRYRHLQWWIRLGIFCNFVRRSHKKRIMLFRASARLQVRPMTCKLPFVHDSWGSFDELPVCGISQNQVRVTQGFHVLDFFWCKLQLLQLNSTSAASYRAQRSQVRNGCCSHGRSTVQDKCGWRGWVSWWSTWL